MLTAIENLKETMKRDGHPDRFVNQYEFLHILVPDMYYMGAHAVMPGSESTDGYGVFWRFQEGQMGPFPVHDEQHKVIKDICEWDKVLTHIPKEEFPAQTLTCELYLEAGIRACEIGYILADRDPVTHENRFGGLDFVRLCIPRRVYTNNHMDVIAAALKNVFDRRETITRGLRIVKEAPLMRHFTVELERLA